MLVEGRAQRGGEKKDRNSKSCGRPFDPGAKFVCVKDCVCLCVWRGQLSDNPLVASWPVAVHIESTCSTARVTQTQGDTLSAQIVCVLAGRGLKMWQNIMLKSNTAKPAQYLFDYTCTYIKKYFCMTI